MTQSRRSRTDRFAEALGASRVVPLEGISAEGPLGLLWLRTAVARDVRGGEPAGVTVTAEQVRASYPEQWGEIERVAAELSRKGPSVDALDLAARLIDHKLIALQHRAGARPGTSHAAARAPSPVLLDSFYEGLDSPADCLESVEA